MAEDNPRYALEVHPTVTPKPVAIWEMRGGRPFRMVADLRSEARATLEEANTMLAALRAKNNG